MSFFQSNNKITKEFSFEVASSAATSTAINKSSGIGVWNLNNEKIVASNTPFTIYTGMTGAGPTYSMKLYSDSFDKTSVLILDEVYDSLDISQFYKLSHFDASKCIQLTAITNPVSSEPVSLYDVNSCNITGSLNMSGLTGLGGSVYLQVNPNLTTVINPTSNTIFSAYYIFNCNITGVLNISGLSGMGGNFRVQNNPNLTGILNPVSSEIFTHYYAYSCGLTTKMDLSNLSGLGGSLHLYDNKLISLTLPTSIQTFTSIRVYSCVDPGLATSIEYINFWPLSGGTNDGIEINTSNNLWNADTVNHVLVDLDDIGWTGGTLIIGGTNAAPDGSSGGYDGTTAKANLITKGWGVSSS